MKMFHTRKQLLAFFMPGFFLGVIYVNFIAVPYMADPGIFSEGFLKLFASAGISAGKYFWYLVSTRIVPFLVLALLSLTRTRKLSALFFLLWTGFSGGILISSAILNMGIRGSVFCMAALFPQFLMYVPAFLVLLWYSWSYPESRWNRQKTVFVLLLLALGMILEVYVNPVLIRWFISIM